MIHRCILSTFSDCLMYTACKTWKLVKIRGSSDLESQRGVEVQRFLLIHWETKLCLIDSCLILQALWDYYYFFFKHILVWVNYSLSSKNAYSVLDCLWEILHFEHTEICMNIQNFFHVFCTVHNTSLQLSNHQFQIYDQKVSSCLSVQFRIKNNTFTFTFTCMHLANAFFQSDLQKRTKKNIYRSKSQQYS